MTTSEKQKKEARLKAFSNAAKLLTKQQQRAAMREFLDMGIGQKEEDGIIRQLLDEPKILLTYKQQYVFDKYIEPSLVEQCELHESCGGYSELGKGLCESCDINLN